jgi:hypothetical protein
MQHPDGRNEDPGSGGLLIAKEYLAMTTLGFAAPVEREMLRWYRQAVSVPGARVRSSVDGTLDRVDWRAGGAWESYSEPLLKYLNEFSFDPGAVNLVNQTLERLDPDSIGSFISARAEAFEVGWFIPERQPIEVLFDWADREWWKQFRQWSARYEIDTVEGLGASLDASAIRECSIPVNRATPRESLECGLLLFKHLGLPYPPDDLFSVVVNGEYSGTSISLWFDREQLIKVGMVLGQPTTEMVVGCGSVLGVDLDRLALYEGVMDSPGASGLEIALLGKDEFSLTFHYGE